MASGSNHSEISEQFRKMGEKLGWFQHGDLDGALKSLSQSSKKKKTVKSRTKEYKKPEDNKAVKTSLMLKKTKVKKKTNYQALNASNTLKKSGFEGFLSSDSDTSFTTVPENFDKIDHRAKVIQLCSDSDSEEGRKGKEDTYISCIGESNLCVSDSDSDIQVPADSRRANSYKRTFNSNDYDESILRNRVSMASMSIDVDSIGEPLVESTRIHRRSSMTFKQLMTSPVEEQGSVQDLGRPGQSNKNKSNYDNSNKGNDENCGTTNIDRELCEGVKNLHVEKGLSDPDIIDESPEVSPAKDVRYITALENLENSNEHSSVDSSGNSNSDYIEVIDVATQTCPKSCDYLASVLCETNDKPDLPPGSYQASEDPVNCMYHNITLVSQKSPNIYCEETLRQLCKKNNPIDVNSKPRHKKNPAEMPVEEYQEMTQTDFKPVDIYLSNTNSMQGSIYEQSTMGNVMSEGGVNDNISSASSKTDIGLTDTGYGDNTSSHFENSVYEVIDVATQTEILSASCISVSEDRSTRITCEDISKDGRSSLSYSDSKNSISISDVSGNNSDLNCNHNSESSTSRENESSNGVNPRSEHVDSRENVENSDLQETNDSVSNFESSNNNKPKNSKVRSKQKASHCFDLSSDSDSITNLDDVVENCEKGSSESSDDSSDVQTDNQNADTVTRKGDKISNNRNKDMSNTDFYNRDKHTDMGNRDETKGYKTNEGDGESWRDSKRYESDSSDGDENLEAFFQKLRKPEKKKSPDTSPESMKDFIVEDDEMSSESDNEEFYLHENQKLERTPLVERLKANMGSGFSDSEESSDDVFSSRLYPNSVTKHKQKKKQQTQSGTTCASLFLDSSESDDGSPKKSQGKEAELVKKGSKGIDTNQPSNLDPDTPLFKTPIPIRRIKPVSSGNGEQKNKKDSNTPVAKHRAVTCFSDYISLSDDDDDNSVDDDSLSSQHTSDKENIAYNQTPQKTRSVSELDVFSKVPTPLSKFKTPRPGDSVSSWGGNSYSFLRSLSATIEDHRRHPDAVKYMKNFKKTREDLVKHLFELYNSTIFDKKLPADLPIIWNKRLLKTAGYCAYKCSRSNREDRTARIELSTKVCDSAERVRDTLIHELCHAAVWILNGVNGGHGNFWRYWARHASKVHTELPTISRCHSYSINTKYTYRCSRCGYSIGRHSKSLDTTKKICGYCSGTFELIQNATPATPQSVSSTASSVSSTPRTPNRFAMFVKDNYNVVKKRNKDLKHGDVMKELSRQFAASKIN